MKQRSPRMPTPSFEVSAIDQSRMRMRNLVAVALMMVVVMPNAVASDFGCPKAGEQLLYSKMLHRTGWPPRGDTSSEAIARRAASEVGDNFGLGDKLARQQIAAKSAIWYFADRKDPEAEVRGREWLKYICTYSVDTDQIYGLAEAVGPQCENTVGAEAAYQCIIENASRVTAELALAKYREAFESARSSADFAAFIAQYKNTDPDSLVPKAKKRQIEAERAEKKEAEGRRARLAAWRNGLKLGDDTFCGAVIEVRKPMIKIAVSVPLQGYPTEVWLKSDALYPPWMAGCQNTNGHLMPVF